MSNVFCGNCGVQAIGGNFCRNCGSPLQPPADTEPTQPLPLPPVPSEPVPPSPYYQPPAPAPTYQQPTYQQPTYQQPTYQQPTYPQPPAPQYPSAPAVPLVNPFAGVTLTDLARDLGALVLLFGALALPWDLAADGPHDGSGRWWVVIATLVSALSVAVPYLVRSNAIPGWGAPQSRLVKYVAAVPYLASVLAVLVNHLIHVNDDYEGIFGPAVGVGLAGALLAAQARASDQEPTGAADRAWRSTVFTLIGAGAAVVAASVLIDLATDLGDAFSTTSLIGVAVVVLTSYVVVVAIPFVGFLNGGREWGRVLAGAGFGIVATQFLGGASDEDPLFLPALEGVKDIFGIFLIAAGTALLVSRPVQRRLVTQPPIESWVRTARYASTVAAAALALSAAGRLLVLIAADRTAGSEIVTLVLLVLGAGSALLIGVLLGGNPDQARRAVLALVGGILLLAVVEIAVGRSGEWGYAISAAETVGWFVLPGLIAFSLLYPAEIRATFQPIAASPPAPGSVAPPAPGFGPTPPAQGPLPPQDFEPPAQPDGQPPLS